MDTLMNLIVIPLSWIMELCYNLVGNYGVAIIIVTLITKIILLPLSVWVQKNSIKMIQMQPEINRMKAKYYGDADTIAEEESKLYKKYKYNPLASLVPLIIQIVLLMGVVEVMKMFDQIEPAHLIFCGINLSYIPSVEWGITIIVPIIAGLSSYLLCVAQNKSNVLQAEQSKASQWGMLILSVGLSLYLGFFVQAGIALYWIASNLFAIVQLYALNAVIPPKKYVDYEALEASREELAALESLGEKKSFFAKDPNAKREREDYKRFFSIRNKHLVFYSESSGFYKYYEEIIEYLLKKTTVSIHYITNDPNDVVFEKAKEQPRLKPYYIGVKKMITLMMKLEANIVVMTTPDLDNFYIKRSMMQKDIEYIFVPHDPSSMHMGFREHSLDNFDTVFCTGPHIAEEVRASEKLYNTKEKTLVEFGYPLIEKLMKSCENLERKEGGRRQILIAPSWQVDNLLDSCVEDLIDSVYSEENKIIVRPHPEYMKRYSAKMQALVEKYKDKIGEGLEFELDFSSNTSVYSSDILVTDWSGIGTEFAFATLKPVIYINTKMKMENENYDKIGIVPQEIRLRNVLGVALEKDEIKEKFADTLKELLSNKEFSDKIRAERERYFYNLGSNGVEGAKYIVSRLVNKKK